MTRIKAKIITADFGSQLKKARMKGNYSQTKMASMIGIDRGTLSRLENGKCDSHSLRLIIATMQEYHMRHGLLTAELNGVRYTVAIQEV